jgi:hypothetical protein
MTAPLRWAARAAGRALVALVAAAAVYFASSWVLFAVAFARLGSRWELRAVWECGVEDAPHTDSVAPWLQAQPPLGVVAWLAFAAFIGAAYAITVWGPWLIVRVLGRARGRGGYGVQAWKPTRIAARVFAWGIVALSAYSLVIFLWDWVEWWRVPGAGPAISGEYDACPKPAFEPWQIPLGVLAFAGIGALALFGLRALRRRATPGGRKDLESPGGPTGRVSAGPAAPDLE